MRVLAELNAAGPLDFGALLRELARHRPSEDDIPLAPLLRALEDEGLVEATRGHPRRYLLRPSGRVELDRCLQNLRRELVQTLWRTGPLLAEQAEARAVRWRVAGQVSGRPPIRTRDSYPPRGPPSRARDRSTVPDLTPGLDGIGRGPQLSLREAVEERSSQQEACTGLGNRRRASTAGCRSRGAGGGVALRPLFVDLHLRVTQECSFG
jgi:hypothetical protein